MDFKDTYIPQYLDVPTRYVFFTTDELGIAILPVAAGLMINQFLGGMIFSLVAVALVRKIKQGTSVSQIYDRAYWLLPSRLFNFKDTPSSDLREMAG